MSIELTQRVVDLIQIPFMKNLRMYPGCILVAAICSFGCNKSGNNFSTTDHTLGLTNSRSWSGTTHGYANGDTTVNTVSGPRDTIGALYFSRILVDTFFSIVKINGFEASVLGTPVAYRSTDPVTHIVVFDSSVTGTLSATLTYYSLQDSMTYQFDKWGEYDAVPGQTVQVHTFLHTNHN
jgi:hypothetical protein